MAVYEIVPDSEQPSDFYVYPFGSADEGTALFSGKDAKARAHDYALLMAMGGVPRYPFTLYYVDDEGTKTPIHGSVKRRPCLLAAGEHMPEKAAPVGPWSEGKQSKLQLSEGYGYFLLVEAAAE